MASTPPNPLEDLLQRLQETLGALAPEPLLGRLRPELERFFEQFQLVPKRDFDAHLRELARLESTVTELKERLAALEAPEEPRDS